MLEVVLLLLLVVLAEKADDVVVETAVVLVERAEVIEVRPVLKLPVPLYWKGTLKLGSLGSVVSVMRKAYLPEGRSLGVKVIVVPVIPAANSHQRRHVSLGRLGRVHTLDGLNGDQGALVGASDEDDVDGAAVARPREGEGLALLNVEVGAGESDLGVGQGDHGRSNERRGELHCDCESC